MNTLLKKILTAVFLCIEAVLYYFVLTGSGMTFTVTAYTGIALCFTFSWITGITKQNWLMVAGLACTVGADYCLVICDPIQQLWGMVFFLGAQIFYAISLYRKRKNNVLLGIRIGLSVVALVVAFVVLKENVDPLALISVCYYANLIMNMVTAFTQWDKCKLLPIGFVLFILCDTIIGLQVASSGYLPIPKDSALYSFLFNGFNTSWMFYLPSQVLIALSTHKVK